MKKNIITLVTMFSLVLFGMVTTGCSSSSKTVASTKKTNCITTKPSKTGFLKYVSCGFSRR